MSFRIDHLPVEVQTYIFSCLRHVDLATLMRVSKSFQRLATPLLWTHIELHRPGWHEHFQYKDALNIDEITRNHQSRNYIKLQSYETEYMASGGPDAMYRYFYDRDDRFVPFLRPLLELDFPSSPSDHTPYKHVKSLCLGSHLVLSYKSTPDFWTVFCAFQNLESLELIIEWPYDPKIWDTREHRFSELESSLAPLTKLRKLCLRGYIPKRFARWALGYPEQLTTLELSILDRPISSSLCDEQVNPPPTRKRDETPLEDTEDDGGEIPWVTEETDSDSESEEDLNDESVGPRALAIFQGTDIPDKLKSLSTLTLTRPAQSSLWEDGAGWRDPICCSLRSERAILQDWIRLIRATRCTLQHLILDQRPFCEEIEMDATGNDEFLEHYSYGSGFQRFKDTVVPVLLEDAEWPVLKSIRFYGFDVPEPLTTEPHPRVQRPWLSQVPSAQHTFLPRIKQRFEPLGVDVGSSLGRRMIFRADEGTVYPGDGLAGQSYELEE